MLGKYRFFVRQRVKPSALGKARGLFNGKSKATKGTVTRVGRFNDPTVLWDGRKTPKEYHPDFVEPVRK